MSYARKNREKIQAIFSGTNGAYAEIVDNENLPIYDLKLMQIYEHKKALSNIQSFKQKSTIKKEYIKEYKEYLQGVITAQDGSQNDVLTQVMLWAFDAKEISYALQLFEYAYNTDMQMPAGHKRNLATVGIEELAQSFLDKLPTTKTSEYATLKDLKKALKIVQNANNIPDQVVAKLFKAIALQTLNKQTALDYALRAQDYDKNSGLKTLINKLTKEIEKGV